MAQKEGDRGQDDARPARSRPKRASKRTLRVAAAFAGAAAFALPWGVLQAAPTPSATPSTQVIALPGGARVVIPQAALGSSGVRYVYVKGQVGSASAATAPATSTHASTAPKP